MKRKRQKFALGDTFAMSPKGATTNGKPVPHEVARAILGSPVADMIAQQSAEPQRNGVYTVTAVDHKRGFMRIEGK